MIPHNRSSNHRLPPGCAAIRPAPGLTAPAAPFFAESLRPGISLRHGLAPGSPHIKNQQFAPECLGAVQAGQGNFREGFVLGHHEGGEGLPQAPSRTSKSIAPAR